MNCAGLGHLYDADGDFDDGVRCADDFPAAAGLRYGDEEADDEEEEELDLFC